MVPDLLDRAINYYNTINSYTNDNKDNILSCTTGLIPIKMNKKQQYYLLKSLHWIKPMYKRKKKGKKYVLYEVI